MGAEDKEGISPLLGGSTVGGIPLDMLNELHAAIKPWRDAASLEGFGGGATIAEEAVPTGPSRPYGVKTCADILAKTFFVGRRSPR